MSEKNKDNDRREQNDYEQGLERAYRGGMSRDYSAEPEWSTGSDVTVPYTRWGERGYGYDRTHDLGFAEWEQPGPFAGRGPKDYRRSDERILEDVNERLTRHGQLDATPIRVSVNQGVVTLQGMVDSRRAKRMAEDTADSVSGVIDVNNQLVLSERPYAQREGSTEKGMKHASRSK